ncbi:MAG: hypothetical protein CVV24_06145 [Ignavibacteriae bacterium HGW-Ignavibacteriae-3]|nr:MAG: hypothetical protein CVV24_06145 [Ignavibacteriae bacterium HGW-Ignavibacteriae-3]
MKKFYLIFIFPAIFAFGICSGQSTQIKDGWFYIDGMKFFVKGIGYETHTRPGQVPWIYSFDPELIRIDLQKIKTAGFNTIRTWDALSEEELKLVEDSGLKIIMGIWIDPQGAFGNQSFRLSVTSKVNNVLNYSNKYNCVIGYLIMNEPQVAHIYNSGAQNLLDIWQSVVQMIRQSHPGIPVSFSNTIIGDYINMNIFDFAGFNAYIYNPVTITDSHGYKEFLSYLKDSRSDQMPFIITEFGLSVSPGISNAGYSYGGNTLEKQTTGNLLMYRGLIDAGAQGGIVFQFHDGWWKGGNEYVHDPSPEEWFGLFEFTSLNDKTGVPRPVWSAFEKYNKAIITNPKNDNIYTGDIPIEIFTTEEVRSFTVTFNNNLLLTQNISNNYFTGSLNAADSGNIKDFQLIFNFYGSAGEILKTETISLLRTKNEIQIPGIKMQIVPSNLNPGNKNYVLIEITNNPLFTIAESKVQYAVHPHIGFDAGAAKWSTIELIDNKYSAQDFFDIPGETKIATFGAGFTIKYGNFSKRIFTQNILTYGSWANKIKANDVITNIENEDYIHNSTGNGITLYQNYPNPFNPETRIHYRITPSSLSEGQSRIMVTLIIYDVLGRQVSVLVNEEQEPGSYNAVFNNARSPLAAGVYICRLTAGNNSEVKKMILIK